MLLRRNPFTYQVNLVYTVQRLGGALRDVVIPSHIRSIWSAYLLL